MKLFFFDFMITEGSSMLPVIANGKILIVNRLSYGFKLPAAGKYLVRWRRPKKGDIVVFWTPFGELAVKRCTARFEDGRFMAVGDNAVESFDSRSYGPVPEDNILGKVMGIHEGGSGKALRSNL